MKGLSVAVTQPRRERLKAPTEVESYDPTAHPPYTNIPDSFWEYVVPKLQTDLEWRLVMTIARMLWRYTGPKRAIPAWTELLTNARFARESGCSVKAVINTINVLCAMGILAARPDPGQHGYRYAFLVDQWPHLKPRPEPRPISVPATPEVKVEADGEEEANPLPGGKSQSPSSRIVILPGRTRTLTLGAAVRRTGRTEIRNDLPSAQVETWEESGVFRIQVTGEQTEKDLPGGKWQTPGQKAQELRQAIGEEWVSWFHKPLDAKMTAQILANLNGAPVGHFVVQFRARVQRGGDVRPGLAPLIAAEVATAFDEWARKQAAARRRAEERRELEDQQRQREFERTERCDQWQTLSADQREPWVRLATQSLRDQGRWNNLTKPDRSREIERMAQALFAREDGNASDA